MKKAVIEEFLRHCDNYRTHGDLMAMHKVAQCKPKTYDECQEIQAKAKRPYDNIANKVLKTMLKEIMNDDASDYALYRIYGANGKQNENSFDKTDYYLKNGLLYVTYNNDVLNCDNRYTEVMIYNMEREMKIDYDDEIESWMLCSKPVRIDNKRN